MTTETVATNANPTTDPDREVAPNPGPSIRVGTWNLNNRGPKVAARQGRHMPGFKLGLLALQGANPSALPTFVEAAGFDWAISASELRVRPPREGSGRMTTSALVGRGEPPRTTRLFTHVHLPERLVVIEIDSNIGPLTAVSYHAPPGVSWGKIKVHHALALARWLETVKGTVIVGCDANTPQVNHPDPMRSRTHWHTGSRKLETGELGDDYVFGNAPGHGLRDALRTWLGRQPDAFEQIRAERPDGPLHITYHTSGGNPMRYDHLWHTNNLTVETIHHDYHGAIVAGSDHALVCAQFPLKL
jgi:hypothetical protein